MITCSAEKLPSPSFSYHMTASSFDTDRTSASPSSSKSAGRTNVGAPFVAVMTCFATKEPAPSFSYHAIVAVESSVDKTSTSPSPSTSAPAITSSCVVVVATTCSPEKWPAPSAFSYQVIVSESTSFPQRSVFDAAITTSRSPSPSTSAAKTEDVRCRSSCFLLITCAVNCSPAPSFSNHTIVTCNHDAAMTSRSSSESRSATANATTPLTSS
mmetsp:Transcript_28154/g.86302  ORF Transcript_28154/g.86302 Transcript_28154/m.86302 type:complete len:213 (-) Transcript_28154:167-805(-)